MANNLSNYAENKILDHVLKTAAFSEPTNIYLALCTADPTEAGTGSTITEPAGNGYARIIINTAFSAAASRAITNDTLIQFAEATGAWGTLTHWAICDAITGGNMLLYGTLTAQRVIAGGEDPSVEIGDLDISVPSGGMSNYLANAILDHLCKVAAFSEPTNIYIALADTTIVDSDTGSTISDPSGGSYARKQHEAYNASSGGAASNNGAITFAQATANWGTITDVALIDASSVGNMLLYNAVDSSQAVGTGNTANFVDTGLDFTLN